MESYPEQCRARDGRTFTRELTPDEQDRLIPPTSTTDTGDDTTQAVPAPGFEDVPEMIVGEGDDDFEPDVPSSMEVEWYNGRDGWQPSGTPPACPSSPLLKTPTNLSLVTSVLYPGQFRSGDYKPHGGFRYDNSSSDEITITAPMDAHVVDGGRYLVNGEIQYTFDFIAPCGIWYRFGHLLTLTPKFAAIAESFPAAVEGDSRTYEVSPQMEVTAGEVIATAVGLSRDSNTFVDWGVYDLRSKNSASENASWAAQHTGQQEQHAVCWFDFLSPADEAIVRGLPPADGVSGSMSDYCL